ETRRAVRDASPLAFPHRAVLVVAAPERQAGAVPQSPHVVLRLRARHCERRRVIRIVAAGVGEVLPDQDACVIAGVVERLRFVEPAAPCAQHVHAKVAAGRNLLAVIRFLDPGGERVVWNPVRAARPEALTVYDELEALA